MHSKYQKIYKMKKLLHLSLLIIGFSSYGQELSLNDLLKFHEGNIDQIQKKLTAQQWNLVETSKPEAGKMGEILYAYAPNNTGNAANSFLRYLYGPYDDTTNRINFQVAAKNQYLAILNSLKEQGTKLINVDKKDSETIETYQDTTTTYRFTTDNKEVFSILILSNKDYNLNYK